MRRTIPTHVLATLLILGLGSGLVAQKPTSKPQKKGTWNSAVGLGGGAGGKFGGRRGGRGRLARGSVATAKAIEAGLNWLASHQQADGGFDAIQFRNLDADGKKVDGAGEGIGRVGITGFCVLPFLGDGSTLRSGPHKDQVKKAVAWLRKQQSESGALAKNALEHAVATHAMVEAFGLSAYRVLQKNAASAVRHLASLQNEDGGFSFEGAGKTSDAFTTCHAVMAYRSAMDFKLTTDRRSIARAETWLKKTMQASGEVKGVGDVPLASGRRRAETAVAAVLLARMFIGHNPREHDVMIKAADRLVQRAARGEPKPGTDKGQSDDQVCEYLTTYSLYQMGGRAWRGWQPTLLAIPRAQRKDGNFAGSWDPRGAGAVRGGRLYSTALSVLTLEAHYRYTRLVR